MSVLLRWLDPILNPLACLPPLPEETGPENAELLLKRLEASLRQRIRFAFGGTRKSLLRGQGLDFADLREYVPGDDIRKIDWNVFARTMTPHVREYQEEKQLTIWLAVDLTPSMRFGRSRTKLHHATELAGLLGLMARDAGHQLGAFLITGTKTEILPPKTGQSQLQQIMQVLLSLSEKPPSGYPEVDPFPEACAQLAHLVSRQAIVFFLSDFWSLNDGWLSSLGKLSRTAALYSIMLADPAETELPANVGLLSVLDPETGRVTEVDSGDAAFRRMYADTYQRRRQDVLDRLGRLGTPLLASTAQEPLEILSALLEYGGRR